MRPRQVDGDTFAQLQRLNGFIDVAVNLVRYDRRFDNVMSNLLGNVIICDTLTNATIIAKAIHNRYRIVTLDGDVIHVGGSMTGGKQEKKTPSLLQQRQQLEDALEEAKTLEQRLPELQREVRLLEEAITELDDSLYRDQMEALRLREVIRAKQSIIDQLQASVEEDEIKGLIEKRVA